MPYPNSDDPYADRKVQRSDAAEVFRQEPLPDPESTHETPKNLDAERSVLAACLLQPDAIDEVSASLAPEDFYLPAHQIIYQSILNLHQQNQAVDAISVSEDLKANHQLDQVGGDDALMDLANYTFSLTHYMSHAKMVKRDSLLRHLAIAGSKIRALSYDAPDNINEVVDQAEKILFQATEHSVSESFHSIRDLLTTAFEHITTISQQQDKLAGVPTGFKDIDDLFHGLRGGDLIILAARPGVGKTSLALNIATNAAKAGYPTAVFSLEMGAEQLAERVLCSQANVNMQHVRNGFVSEADWQQIANAMPVLENIPLMIDDTPDLSIMEARAKARRELRGQKAGLIIVDYLQLMQTSNRRDGNRAVEVGELSRGLKILAKEMNMPVIALSQLSRAVEQRGRDKRPMLSDLRESGSIEQDADIVAFIDRSMDEEEAEADGRPEWGTAKFIVAKYRNGPTRDITLSWNPTNTTFGDYFDDSSYGEM